MPDGSINGTVFLGAQNTAPDRLISIDEVTAQTGLGVSTIYRWMKDGDFPLGVQLSPRCVRWLQSEISAYLQAAKGKRITLRPSKLEQGAGPDDQRTAVPARPRRGRGRPSGQASQAM
jgi:prophage regulatory protein